MNNTHDAIIELYTSLGYSTDDQGCCHGVSLRWLEAELLDEEDLFDAHIRWIEAEGKNFIPLINITLAKKGKNLDEKDQELFAIHAFFDSIKIYQDPENCSLLFNSPHKINQYQLDKITEFASCDKTKAHGNLSKVYSEPLIDSIDEIQSYLNDLRLIFENHCQTPNKKFGLVLTYSTHTAALTYTTGIGWKFMDINKYPSKRFAIKETGELAKEIFDSLKEENHSSPYIAFNSAVLTHHDSPLLPQLKNELNALKTKHIMAINTDIAQREEPLSLACVAALSGETQVIEATIQHGADLEIMNNEKLTLAHYAAQNGHREVIDLLAKNKVNLDKPDESGWTPMHCATEEKHLDVISSLISHQANPNCQTNAGQTPALLAALYNSPDILNYLAKNKADLNHKDKEGLTAPIAAVNQGHEHIVAELVKFGADFNSSINLPVQSLLDTNPDVQARYHEILSKKQILNNLVSLNAYEIAHTLGNTKIITLLSLEKKIHWLYQNVLQFIAYCEVQNNSQLMQDANQLELLVNQFIKALYDPKGPDELYGIQKQLKKQLMQLDEISKNPTFLSFFDNINQMFAIPDVSLTPKNQAKDSFFQPQSKKNKVSSHSDLSGTFSL